MCDYCGEKDCDCPPLWVRQIFAEAAAKKYMGRKWQRIEPQDEDYDGSFDNAVTAIEDAA